MRQLLIAALLAFSAATAQAAPAPSVLDIKHSLRDDNVRPPESFETQSRVLEENFFLRNYTDARPNSTDVRLGNADEYTRKLAELNPGIEMPYNPVVGKLIDMYLGKRRSLVSNMLALHDYYGDIFVEELEKEGLPLELQYLPVIESAINPNAVSRAGATGLWQFMPATAKGLGMEVSTLVDERRDARESSRNAARYLKQLYNIYGDWSLAIAAYNCGPGNVNKARRRAGQASSDFWEIYNYLPSETRGYVPAFIAANYVMNYHDDYGIHRPVIKRPLITDTVEVRERVHFNQIANVLNIPIDEIRMLNPQYRKDVIPGSPTRPYLLTLPSQQVLSYISSRDDILAYEAEKYTPRSTVELGRNKNKTKEEEEAPAEQPKTEQPEQPASTTVAQQPVVADAVEKLTHTVGRGEDLGSIAKQYGVSATDIKKWNNLRRGKVREGEQLVIEVRQRNTVAAVNTRATKSTTTDVPARTTKPASQTARQDNTSVPERTRTRSNTTSTAQNRAVPQRNSEKYKQKKNEAAKQQAAKAKKQKAQKPVEHTVKSGESLEKIAKRYGTTVDALQKANGLKKNQTNLQIDQKLKVPKGSANKKATTADKNQKNSKNSKSSKADAKSKKTDSKSKSTKNAKDTKKSTKNSKSSSSKKSSKKK